MDMPRTYKAKVDAPLQWDELDNQTDLFVAKLDESKTLTDHERCLIVGNIRGFCSQLREWGYGRPSGNNPEE